jgi:hypothetical protein
MSAPAITKSSSHPSHGEAPAAAESLPVIEPTVPPDEVGLAIGPQADSRALRADRCSDVVLRQIETQRAGEAHALLVAMVPLVSMVPC